MDRPRSLLEEVLEAWQYTREGVVAEAENIPASEYGFRPASGSRSVAELLVHIVESGRMAAGELTHPAGDFQRQSFADHVREHAGEIPAEASKPELVALLRQSGAEGRARIAEAGELAMLRGIRRFDGVEGTRLAWLSHAVDHESYHRGQLALYARLVGLVPALTQRIHGDAG